MRSLAFALVLALLLPALALPAAAQAPRAKWTVLVYLDADNNLEEFGVTNLQEIEAAGTGPDVKVVAQFDRHRQYDQRAGDWTDTRRFTVPSSGQGEPGGETLASQEVEQQGEKHMGEVATLRDFLVWGVQRAPADRYFVLLWSHGSAWDGALDDSDTGSGEEAPGLMSPGQIGQALREARAQTGVAKWDLVYFDSCLMATAEMAHALRDEAAVMVAAEELTPGEGAAYPQMMQALKDQPAADARALAAQLLTGFKAKYHDSGHNQGVWAVLSWLDLAQESRFWERYTAFNQALGAVQGQDALTVLREAKASEHFEKPSLQDSEAIDVYDFADRLAKAFATGPLREAAQGLLDTRTAFVGGALAARDRPGAKGITMQFSVPGGFGDKPPPPAPAPGQPPAQPSDPGQSVSEAAAASDATDPVVQRFTVEQREAGLGQSLRFSADVRDANLFSVEGVVTRAEPAGEVVLRFLEATLQRDAAGAVATFTWDGAVHELVAGAQRAPAPTFRAEPGQPTLLVEGNYRSGEERFNGTLHFDGSSGRFLAAYREDEQGIGEVKVQAGDTFATVKFAFDEQGEAVEVVSDELPAQAGDQPWTLALSRLPAGSYGVSIYAEDLVGRSGVSAIETVTLRAAGATPPSPPSPGDAPPPPPPSPPEQQGAPGFAPLGALAALGLAVLVRRRRD